jgi:hypothetical protein
MSRWMLLFYAILFAALVGVVVGFAFGCGPVTKGPFTPGSPRYCSSDPQCPARQHCGPQCLTDPNDGHCHFVCMDGTSDIDSYPTLP